MRNEFIWNRNGLGAQEKYTPSINENDQSIRNWGREFECVCVCVGQGAGQMDRPT